MSFEQRLRASIGRRMSINSEGPHTLSYVGTLIVVDEDAIEVSWEPRLAREGERRDIGGVVIKLSAVTSFQVWPDQGGQ